MRAYLYFHTNGRTTSLNNVYDINSTDQQNCIYYVKCRYVYKMATCFDSCSVIIRVRNIHKKMSFYINKEIVFITNAVLLIVVIITILQF